MTCCQRSMQSEKKRTRKRERVRERERERTDRDRQNPKRAGRQTDRIVFMENPWGGMVFSNSFSPKTHRQFNKRFVSCG